VPVEAKPLFRPDVLRPHLATFHLSERANAARPKLLKWAEFLGSEKASKYKEQEILHDFLTDVFCELLGYARAVDNRDRSTISREKHVQVDGKYADAVLGEFSGDTERFTVALEGKGPKDPLDRPFAGRKMSAVDQGYRYAINLPCDWIIVTSIRQTRLYFKGADQHTYERFDTESLAGDEGLLKKFVYLLGADRVVPASARCHFYDLLSASEKIGRELTKEFYLRYAEIRESAFETLCQKNSAHPPHAILGATQKLLDRILFCAFCEDRGLLPAETIKRAYEHSDPYNPRPVWENFGGLFRAVNAGNPALSIPPYNGGLFSEDPILDHLAVPDLVCGYFRDLAAYDFRPSFQVAGDTNGQAAGKLIDVDILGHIFEQSISDLERIRNEIEGLTERLGQSEHTVRRKKEGAFYTPKFITRYIVGEALGRVLKDRFEQLRLAHFNKAAKAARAALIDPNAFDSGKLTKAQQAALIAFWEDWQEVLKSIRILDPACGSGAFLIEAFDQMYAAFQASNDRLEELRGQRTLFDLDTQILQNNLYGVDLNEEAVEICRLSLWIKTAQRGKPLTSLDHTIRVGNSVIDDPSVHPKAFDWQAAFPEVFANGGFDVVVGNPPYVRQEWISAYKPYFQSHYKVFDSGADLYVYFYELGMRLLRPGGRLSFIVTNKWMKAAYGEPLRKFFAEDTWLELAVDFGHAKQIFEDADVFPSVIIARKPTGDPPPMTARVCVIPREQLRITDLCTQVESEAVEIERNRLDGSPWLLEPKVVFDLLGRIQAKAETLIKFTEARPLSGIKTGFNKAFLIDSATRQALVDADPGCDGLIRCYVRGQDIARWHANWAGLWMIALKSSGDHPWPWAQSGEHAESVFQTTYPSLYAHFKQFEDQLRGRQDQGRYWWELRTCAYWHLFDQPKVIYQDITWAPSFNLDTEGRLSNNTVYFLPTSDLWVIAVLNSPAAWAFAWRKAQHGKDEALRYFTPFVESFPIPEPTEEQRLSCENGVRRLVEITKGWQDTVREVLDWLRTEHGIGKPSLKLQDPVHLTSEDFLTEVRRLRGKAKPLSVAEHRMLREEHGRLIVPLHGLSNEGQRREEEIAGLVSEAYGLSPDNVRLMWETAPPRMPAIGPG
jgi:hypothetical protein